MRRTIAAELVFGFLVFLAFLANPEHAWSKGVKNKNPEMRVKISKAKIKVKGEIKTIPVYHVIQENCIFIEAEIYPERWTRSNFIRTHCVTLAKRRLMTNEGENPPKDTKIFKVPANRYFKIHMTISSKMINRKGEVFGIQIVKNSKTIFTQGGWEVGDSKKTRAIKLKPGEYFWRCPANPTIWYGLIAEDS